MEASYKKRLKDITTFVFDVDGVFTNSQVLVTTSGEMLRSMSVKDGYALKVALDKGYEVCIITGGTNDGVKKRLMGLGVSTFYMGTHQKLEALEEFMEVYGKRPEEIAYMGDDIPDIPPMQVVGLPTCPQNAVPEVKKVSAYISHIHGGQGCVRDLIEQVLKTKGQWLHNFDAKND